MKGTNPLSVLNGPKTLHICSFIEVDLPRGLLDPFSLNVIFNVDNIVISLADRGASPSPGSPERGNWLTKDQGSCLRGCESLQFGIGIDLEQFLRVEIELAFAVPPWVPAWCSTQYFHN